MKKFALRILRNMAKALFITLGMAAVLFLIAVVLSLILTASLSHFDMMTSVILSLISMMFMVILSLLFLSEYTEY